MSTFIEIKPKVSLIILDFPQFCVLRSYFKHFIIFVLIVFIKSIVNVTQHNYLIEKNSAEMVISMIANKKYKRNCPKLRGSQTKVKPNVCF